MNAEKYLSRLKWFSILIFSFLLLALYYTGKLLLPALKSFFTLAFIKFSFVAGIFIVTALSFTVLFVFINQFYLKMRHFEEELEETNILMKKMTDEAERKNDLLSQRNEELSNLHKIIREMTQTMDLTKILDVILESICKYLIYDRAIICLVDEEKRVLKPIHSLGVDSNSLSRMTIPMTEKTNPIVQSMLEKKPRILKWTQDFAHPVNAGDTNDLLHKPVIAVIPLEARGKIIGVLIVDNATSKKILEERNLRELLVYTNQAGLAIENARLYETEKQFKEQLQEQVNLAIKKLEETQSQLIQSEKLSALGEMAAIVSHEVRNPLSTIRGSAELIDETIPAESPNKKYSNFILQEVDRLNRIVTDILSFSQVPRLIMKKISINEIVDLLCTFLQASDFVKHEIKYHGDLDKNLPQVNVDVEQIKQVVLNVIQNACHFMANQKIRQLEIKTYSDSKNVYLKINDTGSGIPPENIKKIFDPFFSTKAKGTGLGLAISQNIVKAHKGLISVESKLNVGSSFTIALPLEN
ncbi:MAG: GAF domain-containing protein [Elusimicrobia bacterium]|nr:GAF domain-containing protein [Elusimicrobiota bacterium]MBU2614097.1 GAF domain-containing protein [Elusimicrobiota bacterium]